PDGGRDVVSRALGSGERNRLTNGAHDDRRERWSGSHDRVAGSEGRKRYHRTPLWTEPSEPASRERHQTHRVGCAETPQAILGRHVAPSERTEGRGRRELDPPRSRSGDGERQGDDRGQGDQLPER